MIDLIFHAATLHFSSSVEIWHSLVAPADSFLLQNRYPNKQQTKPAIMQNLAFLL
jgi:hypothetical protein